MKTLDKNYFYKLLENTDYWICELENILENDLKENYECKQYDYNYRKNSLLQTFEDLYRVIQRCTYFIQWKQMDDLLIQSWLYMEELLNNNREKKSEKDEPIFLPF